MAGRGLLVWICLWAVCLPVADLALAQAQEETAETGDAKKEPAEKEAETADETKETGEERGAAEEQAAQDMDQVETITVTATRVESDLMKTPVAVTVIDQETMDREGVKSVKDLATMVPNMDIAVKNGQSTPMISLRGVRSTNETELGDPAVGVHLDGIYSPRMQGILGLMFDNERVEVLRGPQGTLFGRNSTVGSINIISAKPKLDRFAMNWNVQYGNFNAPEYQGMVNVPLSDTWAVRFAGRYHQRDSYISGYWDPNQFDQRFIRDLIGNPAQIAPGGTEPSTGVVAPCEDPRCLTESQIANFWINEAGDPIYELVPADDDDFYMNAKEWAYRASAMWQPRDKRMSLNLSLQQFRSRSAGGIDLVNCEKLRGRPVYDTNPDGTLARDDNGNPIVIGVNDCSTRFPEDNTYQAVVNVPGQFDLDIMYLRSQFNWDFKDNMRLVYSAGFEDQDRESAQDMEQSLNAWDQAFYFLPGTGSRSWMNEVQLQSQGNAKLNWIAGANFFTETTATLGYFDNPLDEKALFDQPDRSTTSYAIFAQGTYSFTPQWHLTLGHRYSDETKQDKGGRSYICNAVNGCAPNPGDTMLLDGGPQRVFSRDYINSLPQDYFDDPSVYPTFNANDNKGSWSHNDWRVGLDYQKDEDTLFYGYLATGFKAGGIGDVFRAENVVRGGRDDNGTPDILSDDTFFIVSGPDTVTVRTDFDQEEVVTLELGFKQRLLGGRLDLRGAYFFSDYKDMQYAQPSTFIYTERVLPLRDANGNIIYDDLDGDGEPDTDNPRAVVRGWVGVPAGGGYATQNVPGAEIQGFELEYDWRPWVGGRIHGYASWLDTEITEDWITKWDYDCVSYFRGAIGPEGRPYDYNQCQNPDDPFLQVNLRGNDLAVSPPVKLHMTLDHAFVIPSWHLAVSPWITTHWEDASYLTIWNVDKHTDMGFSILPQDIKYTDDKREAWSMIHLGVALYTGAYKAEIYAYNLTDEVVQWWGGAAENVPKGSMSMPRTYGVRVGYQF